MIEKTIFDYLKKRLDVPVFLEYPVDELGTFVLFEKTSGAKSNYLPSATFAFQSYAPSLFESAELNEKLKYVVEQMIELDVIRSINLNSDYNFTDTTTKEYRYQAVYEIGYY